LNLFHLLEKCIRIHCQGKSKPNLGKTVQNSGIIGSYHWTCEKDSYQPSTGIESFLIISYKISTTGIGFAVQFYTRLVQLVLDLFPQLSYQPRLGMMVQAPFFTGMREVYTRDEIDIAFLYDAGITSSPYPAGFSIA
jgi:hypothetical protein